MLGLHAITLKQVRLIMSRIQCMTQLCIWAASAMVIGNIATTPSVPEILVLLLTGAGRWFCVPLPTATLLAGLPLLLLPPPNADSNLF